MRPQCDNSRETWAVASAASLDGWTVGMDIAGRGYDRGKAVRKLGFAMSDKSFARMGRKPQQLSDGVSWIEGNTRVKYNGEWHEILARIAVKQTTELLCAGEIVADAGLAGFLLEPFAHYLQCRADVGELSQLEAIYHPALNAMNHPLAIPARKYLQTRK